MFFLGAGLGLVQAPATEAIMGSLPPAKAGVGSAVNDTARELGGTLGVAIIGSVFSSIYASKLGDALAGTAVPAGALAIAKESVGAANQVAQQAGATAGPQAREAVSGAVDNAFVAGWHAGSWVSAAVVLVGRPRRLALPARPGQRRHRRARRLDARRRTGRRRQLTHVLSGEWPGHGAHRSSRRRMPPPVPSAVVTVTAAAWSPPTSVTEVADALTANGYLPDDGLATAVFLAIALRRPLLLEGEAGVGKTEVAKVLAAWTGGELIRLQCYEGIDAAQAVYDWDYGRQLLHLRAAEATRRVRRAHHRRPRGRAVPGALPRQTGAAAGDRAPARARRRCCWSTRSTAPTTSSRRTSWRCCPTGRSPSPSSACSGPSDPPLVVLTSNRTRDVHDALKRRCLYHWVEHPGFDREVAIVRLRVPEVSEVLARQVAAAVASLRELSLYKPPGVAETIDWAAALGRLGVTQLDERAVASTLGTVLKYREDHAARRAPRLRRRGRSSVARAGR